MGENTQFAKLLKHLLLKAPAPFKHVHTQLVLFYLLAGAGAQNVARKIRKAKQRPILDDDLPLVDRSSDERQATVLAELLATPELPASLLLGQAKKWTSKLFKRPDVQRAVSKVAAELLNRGTLTPRQLRRACREILWLGTRLPEWNRCFCLSHKETQMFFSFGFSAHRFLSGSSLIRLYRAAH